MAETLTMEPNVETTSIENLSEEEQDSLAVGEKMQEAQEQLLAGKYKNAEELEKGYLELQQKLNTNEEPKAEQEEPQQEEAEEPEKPVKEPSAKEKAATKIVKKINDKERYDESNQMKTLIVMQILGNTKTFFDSQSTIVDTNVNEYLNKTIEDQYGILFDMAQGQTMEDMINAQY